MGIKPFKIFKGLDGEVAIDADSAYLVLGETSVCHVYMVGGVVITVHESAQQVASELWGYTTGIGTGYVNTNKIIAISALSADRCRLYFSGNDTADIDMSVRAFIESNAALEGYRSELDRRKA